MLNVFDFFIRFGFNLAVTLLIVEFIYARFSQEKNFYFSYLSIGTVVFLLSFLLNDVNLQLGFAFGLFAIFGIIRYRTDTIPIKEMSYLFVIIGLSVINALGKGLEIYELIATNAFVGVVLLVIEQRSRIIGLRKLELNYEIIAHTHPDAKETLYNEIESRIGHRPKRVVIRSLDYVKDTVRLTIYY